MSLLVLLLHAMILRVAYITYDLLSGTIRVREQQKTLPTRAANTKKAPEVSVYNNSTGIDENS